MPAQTLKIWSMPTYGACLGYSFGKKVLHSAKRTWVFHPGTEI